MRHGVRRRVADAHRLSGSRRGAAARAAGHRTRRCDLEPRLPRRRRARRRSWTRETRSSRCCAAADAVGPTTAARSPRRSAFADADVDAALLTLESEGVVLRGSFTRTGSGDWKAASALHLVRTHVIDRRGTRLRPQPSRVVRSPAARAHPPLHPESAARGDRAGQPGRLHAVPVRVAARRAGRAAHRRRRRAQSSASSTASSSPPARGSARCCRRGSTATTRRCSTALPHRAGRLGARDTVHNAVAPRPHDTGGAVRS